MSVSDATTVTNDLCTVVRDWLLANRPAGVPEAVAIRAAGDTAAVERPYVVVMCDGVRIEHGLLVTGDLVLRMRTQADEQTAAAAARWHRELVGALRGSEGFDDLQVAMQERGYWLRPMVAGEYEDAKDGRRGRRYEQRWKVWVQTGLP